MDILHRFMSCIGLAWPRVSHTSGFRISPLSSDKHAASHSFDIPSPLKYHKRFEWNRTAYLLKYSATIAASDLASRDARRKKEYTLSPLIQIILKRAEISELGDLGMLTTELILLVIDELPIYTRAALALTSTSFMRFEGASCWTAMNGFEPPDENLSFLFLLERDKARKEAKLAYSHCLSLNEPNVFTSVQRRVNS